MEREEIEGIRKTLEEVQRRWDAAHRMSEPDWEPLHRLFGQGSHAGQNSLADGFMFMGYVAGPEGSGGLRLYKHGITRRYLVLDAHSRPYTWDQQAGAYRRTTLSEALARVFEGLERLTDDPIGVYDAEYIRRRNEALRAAGYEVIG